MLYGANKRAPVAILLVLCVSLFSGCASKSPDVGYQDPADPWESVNRGVFAFNEALDSVTLKPIAQVYQAVVPMFVRHRISSFYSNLEDIPTSVNNLLQGQPKEAASDIARVILNTTLGILGTFDVASKAGFEKDYEDFGQTLAVWGVPSGPYVVLPILGPNTVRGTVGTAVDYVQPVQYDPRSVRARNALIAGDVVVARSNFLDKEPVVRELAGGGDFYEAVKIFYLMRLQSEVNDGAVDIDSGDLYGELIE